LQKNGNRSYKVGENLIQIPKKIIEKIIKWSEFPMNQSLFVDRLFYQALLIACVGSEKIIRKEISNETRGFISGVYLKKKRSIYCIISTEFAY
jgi:hypothetical protein